MNTPSMMTYNADREPKSSTTTPKEESDIQMVKAGNDGDDQGETLEHGSTTEPNTYEGERAVQLQEVQQAVFRMLHFAVSQTNLEIDKPLIDSTVAVLHKAPETFTPEEEAILWQNYNILARLVFPATSEGIRTAEQIDEDQRNKVEEGPRAKYIPAALMHLFSKLKGKEMPNKAKCIPAALVYRNQLHRVVSWLATILVVFILLQSYVILLTDVLRGLEQHDSALNGLTQQIKEIKTVNPAITDQDPVLLDIEENRINLEAKVVANFDMLARLCLPWRWLLSPTWKDEKKLSAKDKHFQRIALEQAAGSVLQVLNFYLLPLVLGLLGAVAFIVRRLLKYLATTSYTLNSGRRYTMRLALGALLGMISGIFLAPEQNQLQPFNLPLVVLAFLMGYSVEFAFSIFDALIERGRKAVSFDDSPPAPQAKDGK